MIKITYYSDNYCTVLFEVDPIRPARIFERKLGEAIAMNSQDYHISKGEDKVFRTITSVPCSRSIDELKEMKEKAQEEFTQKIVRLKKALDEFKLLSGLIKKEEKKK